jgi:TolA-binding protein
MTGPEIRKGDRMGEIVIKKTGLIFFMLWCAGMCISVGARAQEVKTLLDAAMGLEKTGRLEEARRMYEKAYASYPDHILVFSRLKELYLRVQAYDSAEAMILRRMKRYPADPQLTVALGEVNYKRGRHREAMDSWNGLLETHPKKSAVVQMVAHAMAMERLYDEAIRVYREGRERIGKPDLFVFNLAGLYAGRMDYGNALEELLGYLEIHPRKVDLVESQIRLYPKSRRIIREMESQIRKAIDVRPEDPGLRKLLAGVFLRARWYDKGMQAVLERERLEPADKQGQALFQYGRAVFQAGEPAEAEHAFMTLLDRFEKYTRMDHVLYQLARSQEAQEKFRDALANYSRVAAMKKKGNLSSEALFQVGRIQRDQFFDLDGARASFQQLIRDYPSHPRGREGWMELAECALVQGDLQEADSLLGGLRKKNDSRRDAIWLKAVVRQARVAYFQGKFDVALLRLDALSYLRSHRELLSAPAANDGLALQMKLTGSMGREEGALRLMAKSELTALQRNYTGAVQLLDTLVQRYRDASLVPEAFFQQGMYLRARKDYQQSVAKLESVSTLYPESAFAERALEQAGDIYRILGRRKQAQEAFETLLVRYPQSIRAEDVRHRLRSMEEERHD